MAGKLFNDTTQTDETNALASFMPGGRAFLAAKLPSTTLRTLLYGLAAELVRVNAQINEITYEHQIDQTTLLIEQWESALGIPDCCFTNTGTLAQRRENVLIKLASCGVQSKQDFIDLAALLGYTVTITPGAERGIFPLTFPLYFFDCAQTARFLMIVTVDTTQVPNTFPFTFPFTFGSNIITGIECLFGKLKPANVEIIFEYRLPDERAFMTESGYYYIGTEDGSFLLLE